MAWCRPPAMLTARSARPSAISRAAADEAAGLVHPREDRVVVGAEAVPRVVAELRCGTDGRQVRRRMDPLHLGGRGGVRLEEVDPLEDAELAGQPDRQIEPDRVE